MWSEWDKLIAEFAAQIEGKLSKDGDLKDNLPLDNLQINVNLDQQTNPALLTWNITVRQEEQELFNLAHTYEMQSKTN